MSPREMQIKHLRESSPFSMFINRLGKLDFYLDLDDRKFSVNGYILGHYATIKERGGELIIFYQDKDLKKIRSFNFSEYTKKYPLLVSLTVNMDPPPPLFYREGLPTDQF